MHRRLLVLLLLLAAAVLRLFGLNNLSPPGLAHDEVANWLIDRAILAGDHAIYFTAAYGHEAGFHYLQAGSVALLGDHALALRLPAAFAGLLLVAVSYALARRLFGWQVALMSMGITAVLFWPVFYSRLGLRAITLPLLSGLSAYVWWGAWRSEGGRARWQFGLAGFLAGLSLHTYMAARAAPIFYGLFLIYLALWRRQALRARWRGVLLFWLALTAVAAPLFIYLQTNPGAEFRITEIDAPLRALLAGDLRPALGNSVKILSMFGFRGDPLWRQNIAGMPVFDPALATLFYTSVLLILWRVRDSRYAFLGLWLFSAATPSIVTIDAPSSIRMVNSLPILGIFPALVIHISGKLSTVFPKLSTGRRVFTLSVLLILTLYHIGRTSRAIFEVWPQNEEVAFVWQAALTETAAFLDGSPTDSPAAIGGWSPATMDPPTMALTLRREDLDLRYFGSDSMTAPINTLIIPTTAVYNTVRVIHPTIRQLAPPLANRLAAWATATQQFEHFTAYTVPFPPNVRPDYEAQTVFGGELTLLGYDVVSPTRLLTYWQVTAPPTGPRRFFLHLLDGEGDILAQHDSLDAPARFWQTGDILLQYHDLAGETAVPAAATLRLGVYDPAGCVPGPCQNLRTTVGEPALTLPLP